jgi:hypothetical protein
MCAYTYLETMFVCVHINITDANIKTLEKHLKQLLVI